MKFTANTKELLGFLAILNKIIPSHAAMPAEQTMKFCLKDNDLTIIARNYDILFKCKMSVKGVTGGEACIYASFLYYLIGQLGTEEVTIDANEMTAKVEWTGGEANVPTINANDFPETAPIDGTDMEIRIPAGVLYDAISKVSYLSVPNSIRPVFEAVVLDVSAKKIFAVASDTHRLAACRVSGEFQTSLKPTERQNILISRPMNAILKNILADSNEEATILAGNGKVVFRTETYELSGTQVPGKYPQWEAVIPTSATNTLKVNRDTFIKTVKRTSLGGDAYSPSIVCQLRQELVGGVAVLTSRSLANKTQSTETMPVEEYLGEELKIAFNPDFLQETLKYIPGESVWFGFTDGKHPVVCKNVLENGEPDDSLTVTIMPIMIPDNV